MLRILLLAVLSSAALVAQTAVVGSEVLTGLCCYDRARERLVFPLPSGDLWEWDGAHWGKAMVHLLQPASRVVYDPARERVFFVCNRRLVAYDGQGLTDLGACPDLGGLVADPARNRLVGFQQVLQNGVDAHEWDGTNWTLVASLPATEQLSSFAVDELRQRVVVQTRATSPQLAWQTWEWDGTTLTLARSEPVGRGTLGYDPMRQQVLGVLSGGTWAWDGSAWTQLLASGSPPLPASFSTDPTHGRLWAGLWAWNGTSWSEQVTAPHAEVLFPGFTYDPVRRRGVLLGGVSYSPFRHREWDGARWHTIAVPPQFPTRTRHAQVYDGARAETLVFGGQVAPGTIGDTWVWNGTNWRLAATAGPSSRSDAAIAFDATHGKVVLVGGWHLGTYFQDHWEWDGVAWSLVSATTPMGPTIGAMGHDAARARTVLFDLAARTWEHDGVAWTQRASSAPVASTMRWLVWDEQRQRLVGHLATQSMMRHEWDGQQWTPVAGAVTTGALTFDVTHSRWLDYRGSALVTETATPAYAFAHGTPGGGSTTPTSLGTFGVPRPGDGAFHLDLRAEGRQRPAMIALGLGAANLPIGNGCTLYIQNPLATFVWFTDAHGCWHQPITLPNLLALRGVAAVAQGAVLDPASAGGLAMTQGVTFVIGD